MGFEWDIYIGGGFKCFLFSPRKLGKISHLTDIFQMGWFNHQPDIHLCDVCFDSG